MSNYQGTHPQDIKYPETLYLRRTINWNRVFGLLSSLQSDKFNEKTMRFVKSDIISTAMEKYSGGRLQYVDENGCDFIVKRKKTRIELKCGECMFPKRIEFTRNIRVFNSLGANKEQVPDTFDYLLVVEPGKAGLISHANLLQYTTVVSDGINARINMADMDIIAYMKDYTSPPVDLKWLYNNMVGSIIENFDANCEEQEY